MEGPTCARVALLGKNYEGLALIGRDENIFKRKSVLRHDMQFGIELSQDGLAGLS